MHTFGELPGLMVSAGLADGQKQKSFFGHKTSSKVKKKPLCVHFDIIINQGRVEMPLIISP